MNYYPHHIGDYLRDTSHLTALEDGLYRRMLDVYYASERPLPIDPSWIARLVRARTEEEQLAVVEVLRQFFTKYADGWHNKRADSEIKKGKARVKAAITNGKRGGRPITQRVSKNNPAGGLTNNPDQSSPKAKSQKPKPNNNTGADAPSWLPRDEWHAFEDSRKKLRKPMTDRARELVVAELAKLKEAGHDPAAVLAQSVRKGWLDVFPLKDGPKQQTGEVI